MLNKIEPFDKLRKYSETFYLISFGILSAAKSVGFVEGTAPYTITLVIGFVFFMLKVLTTDNSRNDWIAGILLIGLGGVIYLRTGDKGFLIYMTMMLGMKNVSMEKVFKWGAIIWTTGMALMITLTETGLIEEELFLNEKQFLGEGIYRRTFGFPHPNSLGITAAVMTMFLMFYFQNKWTGEWRDKYLFAENNYSTQNENADRIMEPNPHTTRNILILTGMLVAFDLFIFIECLSFTGAAVAFGFLILNLWLYLRKRISKVMAILLEAVFPLCLIISIVLPLTVGKTIYQSLETTGLYPEPYATLYPYLGNFTNRLYLGYHAMAEFPILPVGVRLDLHTGAGYNVIDSSYVWLIVQFGIIATIVITVLYLGLIHRYVKEDRRGALAIIVALLLGGILEPYLFNSAYKNIIFLFAGEYLYRVLNAKEKIKLWQRKN